MKRTITTTFSRTALMLLVMMLTAQTAADANNDKSVNAADIVTIVNIIMGH